GACGNECMASTYCTLGKCVATCPTGLTGCNNACVDPKTDNNNCGGGNPPRKDGSGCGGGRCVTGIKTTPGAGACVGIGPPINPGGPGSQCSGNIATTSFTWALCSCTYVKANQMVYTDGFDSNQGPYVPGKHAGAVGMNGNF